MGLTIQPKEFDMNFILNSVLNYLASNFIVSLNESDSFHSQFAQKSNFTDRKIHSAANCIFWGEENNLSWKHMNWWSLNLILWESEWVPNIFTLFCLYSSNFVMTMCILQLLFIINKKGHNGVKLALKSVVLKTKYRFYNNSKL